MPLYKEQLVIKKDVQTLDNGEEVVTPDAQIIYRVIDGVEKAPVFTKGYDYSALAAEVAKDTGRVLLRRYPVTDDEAVMDLIMADIAAIGEPTLQYTVKDNGFTVIWIKDRIGPGEEPENFQLREWMDFRTFALKMSSKTPKRMGYIGQSSYWYETFRNVRILWNDEPEGKSPKDHRTITIRIITEEHAEMAEELVDGNNIMRPWLVKRAANRLQKQLIASFGEKKAKEIADNHRFAKAFNARMTLDEGLVKGDNIVAASDEAITADFVVYWPNYKPELRSADGVVRFLAFPQAQHEHVKLNRQSIAHFYQPLFAGIVEEAFTQRVNEMTELMMKGKVPGWLMESVDETTDEFDAEKIADYKARIAYFIEHVGSLNNSPAMLNIAANQMRYMLEPKDIDDDERGKVMFIPEGKNVSIRSYTSYLEAGYEPRPLQKGQAFFHRLGLVMEDNLYLAALPILGGADADDHITVIPRVALEAHARTVHQHTNEFATFTMSAEAGQIVLVIYRDPIGVASNGEEVASEWLFVTLAEGEEVTASHSINLAAMPRITGELKYPEPMFDPRDEVQTEDTYTQKYAVQALNDAIQYAGVYGSHSNRMTVIANHRIAIPFYAFETVYADECQQHRRAKYMAWIKANNKTLKRLISGSRVMLDPLEKKRLGLEYGRTRPGVFTHLSNFHKREVSRFNQAVSLWLTNHAIPANRDRLAAYRTTRPTSLIEAIEKAEIHYRRTHGIRTRFLDWKQWAEVGDFVVDRLSTDREVRNPETGVMEQRAAWTQEQWNDQILRSMYYMLRPGSDRADISLTNGKLFFKLCDALAAFKKAQAA